MLILALSAKGLNTVNLKQNQKAKLPVQMIAGSDFQVEDTVGVWYVINPNDPVGLIVKLHWPFRAYLSDGVGFWHCAQTTSTEDVFEGQSIEWCTGRPLDGINGELTILCQALKMLRQSEAGRRFVPRVR